MKSLKFGSVLKPHWFKIVICVLLLALQATAVLALPGFISNLISVGIQQMGVDSEYPEVMGEDTVAVIKRVLPDETSKFFMSQYMSVNSSEADTDYECNENAYCVIKTDDTEKLTEIYRNALMTGISLTEGNIKNEKSIDYELLRNYGSIHQLNVKTWDFELSESEREQLYNEADSYAPSIKNQVASMALPFIYEDAGVDTESLQTSYVKSVTVKMAVCIVAEVIALLFTAMLAADISSKCESTVKELLINHISGFTRKESQQFSSSQLASSVSVDTGNIGMMIDYGIRIFLYAPFAAIGGTVLSFKIHSVFGILILVVSVVIAVLMEVAFKIALGHYNSLQENSFGFVSAVRRNLENMFMIRAASAEKSEEKKISITAEKIRKEESFVLKALFTAVSLIALLTNIITAAAVLIGANRLLNSTVELGGIISFLQYSVVSVSAFMMLGAVAVFAPGIIASVKNINHILSVPLSVKGGNETAFAAAPDVEFRNIKLCGKTIDFTAPYGRITAIAGKTGSGKSALVSFVNRYSDPDEGSVFIGGRDIKSYNMDFLCSNVAVYDSIPCILTGTVRKNIAGNFNIGNEQLLDAMRKARVDFVSPDDYIVNSGENLSGGQKSRLALASCFIRNCSVFVFDDCMTALDEKTENEIFSEINKLKNNACVIIVSQRPEILMKSDSVAVLEKDEFFFGTPTELIEKSLFFRDLVSRNGGALNG